MDERDKPARGPLGGCGRLLVAAAVAVLGFGTLGAGAVGAADYPVAVTSNEFTPEDLTIAAGDTVIWRNTQGNHNVVFEDMASFRSPPRSSVLPWTRQRAFTAAGTFPYFCALHDGHDRHRARGRGRAAAPTRVPTADPRPRSARPAVSCPGSR